MRARIAWLIVEIEPRKPEAELLAAAGAATEASTASKAKTRIEVGTARFELATFRSQSERATRLRHVPWTECTADACCRFGGPWPT